MDLDQVSRTMCFGSGRHWWLPHKLEWFGQEFGSMCLATGGAVEFMAWPPTRARAVGLRTRSDVFGDGVRDLVLGCGPRIRPPPERERFGQEFGPSPPPAGIRGALASGVPLRVSCRCHRYLFLKEVIMALQ